MSLDSFLNVSTGLGSVNPLPRRDFLRGLGAGLAGLALSNSAEGLGLENKIHGQSIKAGAIALPFGKYSEAVTGYEDNYPKLWYSHYAQGPDIETELNFLNAGNKADSGIVLFLDDSGSVFDEEGYSLNAWGSMKLNRPKSQSLKTGYVVVLSDNPDSRISGNLIYHLNGQVSVPDSRLGSRQNVLSILSSERNSGLSFVNPNDYAIDIKLTARDGMGVVKNEKYFTLGPNEHLARFINEDPFFVGLDDFKGTISAVSEDGGFGSDKFTLLGLMQYNDKSLATLNSNPTAFEGVPKRISGRIPDEPTQVFSRYATGNYNGLPVKSEFVLKNMSDEAANYLLEFCKTDGSAAFPNIGGVPKHNVSGVVEPGGMQIITTDGTLEEVVSGYATLKSSVPELEASITFNLDGQVNMPSSQYGRNFSFYMENNSSYNSGLAITNVSDREISIDAFLIDEDGNVLNAGNPEVIMINAGESLARFVDELFDSFDKGTVHLSSKDDFYVTGLRQDIDKSSPDFGSLAALAGSPTAYKEKAWVELHSRDYVSDVDLKDSTFYIDGEEVSPVDGKVLLDVGQEYLFDFDNGEVFHDYTSFKVNERQSPNAAQKDLEKHTKVTVDSLTEDIYMIGTSTAVNTGTYQYNGKTYPKLYTDFLVMIGSNNYNQRTSKFKNPKDITVVYTNDTGNDNDAVLKSHAQYFINYINKNFEELNLTWQEGGELPERDYVHLIPDFKGPRNSPTYDEDKYIHHSEVYLHPEEAKYDWVFEEMAEALYAGANPESNKIGSGVYYFDDINFTKPQDPLDYFKHVIKTVYGLDTYTKVREDI